MLLRPQQALITLITCFVLNLRLINSTLILIRRMHVYTALHSTFVIVSYSVVHTRYMIHVQVATNLGVGGARKDGIE